jgi:LmbE family N-acetylglucosaminyl deacetylase
MGADEPFSSGRIAIVAAHPDDEVIGAGAQLPRIRDRVSLVHVTNGSPPNPADALNAGFPDGAAYAAARRRELLCALSLAAVAEEQCLELGFGDQRASFHLAEVAVELARVLDRLQPDIVLTHPYEGGHPDHDACAFAVRAAARTLEIWEFTSYHAAPDGRMETGRFLDPLQNRDRQGAENLPGRRNHLPHLYRLTPDERALKQRMFDCFSSQQHVLAAFSLDVEQFRPAPEYDFTQPPHPGRLHYEQFDWGVTGPQWRELAAAALSKAGLDRHATHSS